MGKKYSVIIFSLLVIMNLFTAIAQGETKIVINVPAFTLYLYEYGVQVKSFPIGVGSELKPSVLGPTRIINNVVDPTYYPPKMAEYGLEPIPPGPDNPVGSRWLGLDMPGYGIHGTDVPQSIGKAASAGCIRMRNEDVEKLSSLVKVGTPVEIIYQTVLLLEDPLLHTKTITVYPDLYNRDTSHEQLLIELEHKGWNGVFWPIINELIDTPTARPSPMAWALSLKLDGTEIDLNAVEVDDTYYLPFDFILDPKLEYFTDLKKWGEQYFLPLSIYEQLTGFRYSKAQGFLTLHSPHVYAGEEYLGKALIHCGEIYINSDNISRNLIPEKIEVLSFWGNFYLPASKLRVSYPHDQLRLEWTDTNMLSWE